MTAGIWNHIPGDRYGKQPWKAVLLENLYFPILTVITKDDNNNNNTQIIINDNIENDPNEVDHIVDIDDNNDP